MRSIWEILILKVWWVEEMLRLFNLIVEFNWKLIWSRHQWIRKWCFLMEVNWEGSKLVEKKWCIDFGVNIRNVEVCLLLLLITEGWVFPCWWIRKIDQISKSQYWYFEGLWWYLGYKSNVLDLGSSIWFHRVDVSKACSLSNEALFVNFKVMAW